MPEIKIQHVVSFSSEDKVHKAENLVKAETYRKWKCCTPGEKSAIVVLQFEKAFQINSIDIGNEGSAFVEVLVGRSSDTTNDFQVLLVASSFMSPLESRNGTHTNRVRMFGPEKLSQTAKDEKWDRVQIVCTQPFNKTVTYGLSFVKFHSLPEKSEEQPKNPKAEAFPSKLGAFKFKYLDDDDDDSLTAGSFFEKQKAEATQSPSSSAKVNKTAPSYANVVLEATSNMTGSPQNNTQKRKIGETKYEPPSKKASVTDINKEHIVYKEVLRNSPESKKVPETNGDSRKNLQASKLLEMKKGVATPNSKPSDTKKIVTLPDLNTSKNENTTKPKPLNNQVKLRQNKPLNKIMDKVVFVLSGFVNPLRTQLRDMAITMGAKYRVDWDRSCTHLVCAFLNTPKYEQVKKLNGKIVSKEWILDCYKSKTSKSWFFYKLDKSNDDSSDGSEYVQESSDAGSEEFEISDEEQVDKKKNNQTIYGKRRDVKKESADEKKNPQISSPSDTTTTNTPIKTERASSPIKNTLNISSIKNTESVSIKSEYPCTSSQGNISDNSQSPTLLSAVKDESETDDEEALQDYIADTDVDDDSGGDTEDEIRKVEMEIKKNGLSPHKKTSISKDREYLEKPDVTDLPLPALPNLFKQKRFYLYGDFTPSKQHDICRFITAYNGVLENYMSNKVKYVITDTKWDKHFDDALDENEDLVFVKPTWIYKCHDAEKLVPYQPYIVIPDT